MNAAAAVRIVAAARREGRGVLLEPEGLALLEALGVETPPYKIVRGPSDLSASTLERFEGERVVVKVISPRIPHRQTAGGVRISRREVAEVRAAIDAMARHLEGKDVRGFSIHELVPYRNALGTELMLALRWTAEFGPVIACGLGGTHAELLARALGGDAGLAIASPALGTSDDWLQSLGATVAGGVTPFPAPELERLFTLFARTADSLPPDLIAELEINPIVPWRGRSLALDVLVTLPEKPRSMPVERPIGKIDHLLHPRSIAIVGVTGRANPSRVMLDNILDEGFDPERLYVVRSGVESVRGCRAVADLEALPEPVDLLIVGVAAAAAHDVVLEAIRRRAARSVIVISGGLGETPGSERRAASLRAALADARASTDRGPVINGGNCLGIRSAPGGYDSLFIPRYKLPAAGGGESQVAFISQSGALLVAKMSRLDGVDLRYAISAGNQLDLTLGDYLTYLQDDPALDVYAVYAEGFEPGDGLRFVRAARRIRARGGTVILYRGGRTEAGARAAASHTAAMAGSYAVTRALAKQAGIVVADSLGDFEDLIRMFARLRRPAAPCRRLAVVSNAGFECVAASDHLGDLELADFSAATRARLAALLARRHLDGVVGVRNPLDLTPMLGDAEFVDAVRTILEDDNVDAAIVGCVPLTPVLATLEPGASHAEDVFAENAVGRRLIRLAGESTKPWVAVVDGGTAYDALAALLRRNGVPTFASIDRAARLMGVFCGSLGTRVEPRRPYASASAASAS